jgi:hypothetical protein
VAGAVDQDVDVTGLFGETLDIGWVGQVGRDESRLPAGCFDLLDDGGAARGVASDDDHLHAVAGEPHGDRLTQPGGRSGHQGGQGLGADGGIRHGVLLLADY